MSAEAVLNKAVAAARDAAVVASEAAQVAGAAVAQPPASPAPEEDSGGWRPPPNVQALYDYANQPVRLEGQAPLVVAPTVPVPTPAAPRPFSVPTSKQVQSKPAYEVGPFRVYLDLDGEPEVIEWEEETSVPMVGVRRIPFRFWRTDAEHYRLFPKIMELIEAHQEALKKVQPRMPDKKRPTEK